MTTYAIGDVQGCYSSLRRLLDKIDFQPLHDTLWFVGDLINRGSESLATLHFIRSLGNNAVVVLGNHDLHLMAVAQGLRESKHKDSLDDILNSPDREALLFWLRQQKLLYTDKNLGYSMSHAGIYPTWNLSQATAYANEVEAVLHSDDYLELLAHLYGNEPAIWQESLKGWDRLRCIVNVFTRMRYLDDHLGLNFSCKTPVEQAPSSLKPWFSHNVKALEETHIVFGHWSALRGETHTRYIEAIDTGCVWGYELTALNLENGQRTSVGASPE